MYLGNEAFTMTALPFEKLEPIVQTPTTGPNYAPTPATSPATSIVPVSKFDTPLTPKAPWLTGKNILIGAGTFVFAYLAYGLLTPRKKSPTAAAISGFGRLFGKRRRR